MRPQEPGDLPPDFSAKETLIFHLEHRRILRPRLSVIVQASRGNAGMTEPFLRLGDVGTCIDRAGSVQVRGGPGCRFPEFAA